MSTAAPIIVERPNRAVVSNDTAEFRRRVKSISRHSTVYFAGTLFTAVSGYFFKIYLARTLGAEALGIYALGISIVGVIGLFNAVGLPTAGAKFVSEYSSRGDYARLGAFLRGALSLLGFGNIVLGAVLLVAMPSIAVRFYHTPALASYSWSFAAIMLLGVLNTFLGQCMAGFSAVARRTVITHFMGTSGTILLAVVLISLHFGLGGYLVAQVASATLILGCLVYSVWKLTPPPARNTGGLGHMEKRVVAFSTTTFGIAMVHFVLAQADKITLGYYLNVRQVGIYAVSIAVAGFVSIALTSVNQIFSPMIAELHSAGNHQMLQLLYAWLTKWVLVFTIPLAAAIIIFAGPVMTAFGGDFRSGAAVLAVCAIAQIVNCGAGSVGFLLLMSGNHLSLMKIQAVNAILMVALNVLLVPRLGILGAALGLSTSIVGTNVWCLAEVRKRLHLFPYNRSYAKVVLSAIVTTLALVLQRNFLPHATWRAAGFALPLAYMVFLGAMFVVGFDAEDRMLARLAWSKIWGANNGVSNE
ncbi:MAG TPA: flippase [Terriglobales bacterium]|nr:flippase [Terriglobales bacterium]